MVIIEDTRQQAGKHEKKNELFKAQGVDVIRSKLPFGDYALAPRIAVDTKASLHEIANNLCGSMKEQTRFREECKLAQRAGSVLVYLIEVGKYRKPADLIGHDVHLKSGKTVPGEQLYRAMMITSERYGCRFEFCPPGQSGHRVLEILGVVEYEREGIHKARQEDSR